MKQTYDTLSLKELAASTHFTEAGLLWSFPDTRSAREHLRLYEPYLSHWGFQCKASEVIVKAVEGNREWRVSAREQPLNLLHDLEASPVTAFQPISDNPNYLLVAEQRLSAPLVSALIDMQNDPGIKGIVRWDTQKQVVLTTDCTQLPIGNQLEDCLNYSRSQYWHLPDFHEFLRRCRQELREDGSNTLEFTYLNFDPTTGGDWMKATVLYRMIDAGRLGTYQIGHNLAFESVPAPN